MKQLAAGLIVSLSLVAALSADDWPQWRGPTRDGVWRERGIIEKLPNPLPVVWRKPIGGGYAGPAVAQGKVFVTDRALGEGEKNPDDPFDKRSVEGKERVLCLDAATGNTTWTHEYTARYTISYPFGPRTTPTVDGDRVYTVGAMGKLFALAVKDGQVLWAKDYVADYKLRMNTWGISSAPLVHQTKVIAVVGGTDGAGVVAFGREGGKELWRALSLEDPGYAPPVLIQSGGREQIIIWTPYSVASLDPETGKSLWDVPFKLDYALSVPTPIFIPETNRLLVTAFYNGSLMLQLDKEKPAATVLWKGKKNSEKDTDGLHAILCTPFHVDGHLYGVCSYGQLRCLKADTGERVWESLAATGSGRWWNAFLVPHADGRVFIANEQGELITARLTPRGYVEESRAPLIEPTGQAQRRKIVWSHPAFANRRIYARNDKEIICVDLAVKP